MTGWSGTAAVCNESSWLSDRRTSSCRRHDAQSCHRMQSLKRICCQNSILTLLLWMLKILKNYLIQSYLIQIKASTRRQRRCRWSQCLFKQQHFFHCVNGHEERLNIIVIKERKHVDTAVKIEAKQIILGTYYYFLLCYYYVLTKSINFHNLNRKTYNNRWGHWYFIRWRKLSFNWR